MAFLHNYSVLRYVHNITIYCNLHLPFTIGERSIDTLHHLGISTPIAINCSRISSLGAYGCSTVGKPVDINTVSFDLYVLIIFNAVF